MRGIRSHTEKTTAGCLKTGDIVVYGPTVGGEDHPRCYVVVNVSLWDWRGYITVSTVDLCGMLRHDRFTNDYLFRRVRQ